MKVLYLHIGTAKTGSTAIQKFLKLNQEKLTEQGYCYPMLFADKYKDENKNAQFLIAAKYDAQKKRKKEEELRFLEEGMDQISECFRNYDNVILSEERIWWASSYLKPELFSLLQQEMKKRNFVIRVVAYLRRQDSFIESHWNQQIKGDRVSRTCEQHYAYLEEERPLMLDYASKLEETASYFGEENMIVRRYEPGQFEGGNIYTDFAKAVGLKWDDEFKMLVQTPNDRLKGTTHEIKRVINGMQELDRNEVEFFRNVLTTCSKERTTKDAYSMFSAEEKKEILDKYSEGNLAIAQKYIKDGKPLFTDKVSEQPKWDVSQADMKEDMIRFVATATAEVLRENQRLEQEVRELKDKLKHPIRTCCYRWFDAPRKK